MLTASLGKDGGGVAAAVRALAVAVGDEVRVYGKGVQGCRVRGLAAFGYMPGLIGQIWRDGVEILHTHGLWMYPSVASVRWGRQRLVSPHGMLERWALDNAAWKKRVASWLYEDRHLRGAACLHALNDRELTSIRAYGLRNPACVIPNGVDLPTNTAEGGEAEKRLVFLGRLHPKKGLPLLLAAWAKVRPKGWRLVLSGWDQCGHEQVLRKLAGTLGILGSVEFAGPKFGKEKDDLMRRADAFILPSYSEGLPVAVLEAWSYALPVLMTPACNLQEGFEAGCAVKLQATEAGVAEGLEGLKSMRDAELREMGNRGRKLVEERFTWKRIAEEMVSVYAWVLDRGPRPACVRLD